MSASMNPVSPDPLTGLREIAGKLGSVTGVVLVVTFESGNVGHWVSPEQADAFRILGAMKLAERPLLSRIE